MQSVTGLKCFCKGNDVELAQVAYLIKLVFVEDSVFIQYDHNILNK